MSVMVCFYALHIWAKGSPWGEHGVLPQGEADGGGGWRWANWEETQRYSGLDRFNFTETWLLFVEYVHDWGWDELHDRVHDALFLLLVATAGRHRLLWTGEAALGGLLHRGRCLRFLLLFLLDAVLHGQMKGWRRGSGYFYSLGDAQRGTWRQTCVFQHLVSDAGLPFCYLWLCFNKIDTSGLYVKWLQCTEGSIDGVMVDLEAEMWKMSWTPAWPLCCPRGLTIMWFWTYKGLKGGLPLSGAMLCRKKHFVFLIQKGFKIRSFYSPTVTFSILQNWHCDQI